MEIRLNLNYSRSDAIWLAWAGGKNIPTGNILDNSYLQFGGSRKGFMEDFYKRDFAVIDRKDLKMSLERYMSQIRKGFAQDILKKTASPGPISAALECALGKIVKTVL